MSQQPEWFDGYAAQRWGAGVGYDGPLATEDETPEQRRARRAQRARARQEAERAAGELVQQVLAELSVRELVGPAAHPLVREKPNVAAETFRVLADACGAWAMRRGDADLEEHMRRVIRERLGVPMTEGS